MEPAALARSAPRVGRMTVRGHEMKGIMEAVKEAIQPNNGRIAKSAETPEARRSARTRAR